MTRDRRSRLVADDPNWGRAKDADRNLQLAILDALEEVIDLLRRS